MVLILKNIKYLEQKYVTWDTSSFLQNTFALLEQTKESNYREEENGNQIRPLAALQEANVLAGGGGGERQM